MIIWNCAQRQKAKLLIPTDCDTLEEVKKDGVVWSQSSSKCPLQRSPRDQIKHGFPHSCSKPNISHFYFRNINNKSVQHLSHLFHLPCLWHFVLSVPDSSCWCSLPLWAYFPHVHSSSPNADRTVLQVCVSLCSWCRGRGCLMRSGRPTLRLQQSPGFLLYQESCPRWCRSGGRRGSRLSGRGGWGRKIGQVSCGSSAGSSGEAWPWPMPVMTTHKGGESKRALVLPPKLAHWTHKNPQKSQKKEKNSPTVFIEGDELNNHMKLKCESKRRGLAWMLAAPPSTWQRECIPTDSPTLTAGCGATAWKVSSSGWKMIAQRCFHSTYQPLQRCHTSTAVALSPTLRGRKRALFTSWTEILQLFCNWLFTEMILETQGMTHHLHQRQRRKEK